MGQPSRKVLELLTLSTDYLKKAGVDTPRLDAEVLLAYCLGLERIWLYVYHDRPVTEEELNCYRRLIARRGKHCPVAYLTGEKEFMSLSFHVTPDVLIPRPDTEILVESVITRVSASFPEGEVRIVDIGTGSGAIAVSLAHLLPHVSVMALDISPKALTIAEDNAQRHGVASRCRFIRSDLLSGLPPGYQAHVLVSNPPYISLPQWEELPRSVREYEPEIALKAGADGLDFYRRIFQEAPPYLLPGGYLFLEIGAGQREAVCQLGMAKGWNLEEVHKDHAGIERVLVFCQEDNSRWN